MKKQPNKGLMFLLLMGIFLIAFVLRYFLAPRWIVLIVAPLLGVWLHYEDKRWRCPHCKKHFGRWIRHMDTCPYCGWNLRIEQ